MEWNLCFARERDLSTDYYNDYWVGAVFPCLPMKFADKIFFNTLGFVELMYGKKGGVLRSLKYN